MRKCANSPRVSFSSVEEFCPCNIMISTNRFRLKYRFVCCFCSLAMPPFFLISFAESESMYSWRVFSRHVAFGGAGEPVPGEGVRGGKSVLLFGCGSFVNCLTKYFFDLELYWKVIETNKISGEIMQVTYRNKRRLHQTITYPCSIIRSGKGPIISVIRPI